MNDLREKIKELVHQQPFMFDDGGLVADRILALIASEQPATAKLPEGVVILLHTNGKYAIIRNGYFAKGWYETKADALAAALEAPPVPTETKSRDGCKPSPSVTHADMLRLADLGEQQGWPVLPKLLREIFKEPT